MRLYVWFFIEYVILNNTIHIFIYTYKYYYGPPDIKLIFLYKKILNNRCKGKKKKEEKKYKKMYESRQEPIEEMSK